MGLVARHGTKEREPLMCVIMKPTAHAGYADLYSVSKRVLWQMKTRYEQNMQGCLRPTHFNMFQVKLFNKCKQRYLCPQYEHTPNADSRHLEGGYVLLSTCG
jgi:hypothetical protein